MNIFQNNYYLLNYTSYNGLGTETGNSLETSMTQWWISEILWPMLWRGKYRFIIWKVLWKILMIFIKIMLLMIKFHFWDSPQPQKYAVLPVIKSQMEKCLLRFPSFYVTIFYNHIASNKLSKKDKIECLFRILPLISKVTEWTYCLFCYYFLLFEFFRKYRICRIILSIV